jgi:hypothetical protein
MRKKETTLYLVEVDDRLLSFAWPAPHASSPKGYVAYQRTNPYDDRGRKASVESQPSSPQ